MDRFKKGSRLAHRNPSTGRRISHSAFLFAFALAAIGIAAAQPASALTVDYVLTPGSNLVTEISSANDFFTDTGLVPTWLDGALATPPVGYGGDAPAPTLNRMHVEFTDDGSGNIINGPITITLMDYYHPTDASLSGIATITGINDSNVSGATGNLVGTVVGSWSTNLTGTVHNELTCTNAGASICGSLGLPASGTTNVVHDVASSIAIDTLASPVAASLPMTFSADFSTVTMQMTLATTPARQYYAISGVMAAAPVPLSSTGARLLLVGLMTLAGLFVLRTTRSSSGPSRAN